MLGVPVTDLVMLLVAIGFGVPLIAVDVREHRLPNPLTGGAAITIVVAAVASALVRGDYGRLLPMLITALAMAGVGYLAAVISPSSFGLGDVKLLGVIGLALGHLDPQTVVVWLLALAAASAAWLVLSSRFDTVGDRSVPWRKRHIAFGPPMIVAWWLVYVVLMVAVATRG